MYGYIQQFAVLYRIPLSRNRTVGASIGEAPCSRVYLAYSLRQLRVGILPPYALDPYNRLRNVL